MIVNREALDLAYKGFKSIYSEAHLSAPSQFEHVAMTVSSVSSSEDYAWLGNLPNMREWVGSRVINNLSAYGFTITNKKFEATISVERVDFEDDRIGLHKPAFAELGSMARRHPDELVFGLLKDGFTSNAYDGQSFFDTDHPVVNEAGATVSVANTDGGSGSPWFLLDVSRAVRPIIFQERVKYEFQQLTATDSEEVFLNDRFLYGVRARVNAGFGLWQLAWGSRQALNSTNYKAARAAVQGFRADGGRLLGITPSVMVVPPALEEDGLKLVNSELGTGGETNPWRGTARLIVSPWLS